MAATCRWSVPQQPPTTQRFGSADSQPHVVAAELLRIAGIELGCRIELRVAAPRSVGTHAAQPRASLAEGAEHALEVRRVGAVDHVVGRRGAPARGRIGVDGVDRRA